MRELCARVIELSLAARPPHHENRPAQYRNQRLGRPKQRKQQQQLLDVSICARQGALAPVQRSVAASSSRPSSSRALVAGAWIGGKEALRRFVWENPDATFSPTCAFPTDGTLTREQVLSTGGVVEGSNIFTRRSRPRSAPPLEQLPQVESAEVQRSFPNRIDIESPSAGPSPGSPSKGDNDPDRLRPLFPHRCARHRDASRKVLPEYYSSADHLRRRDGKPRARPDG